MTQLVIVPLDESFDRKSFSCGVEALDRYFRERASQDIRRRLCNCFVAAEAGSDVVAGYYTLSAASIPLSSLPLEEAKRLPRYPILPATLIGGLAVDDRFQGRGIGASLLIDALHRSAQAAPASHTILVDAKDEAAAGFCRKYGFSAISSRPLTLYLPIWTALRLFDVI